MGRYRLVNKTAKEVVDVQDNLTDMEEAKEYFYLLLAVFIGGQIGNFLNLKLFSTKILALITSILVIFVAIRMGFNIFNF